MVAIIGILAAVAIPAYQDYTTKAKLSKVVTSIDALKLAIVTYNNDNGGITTLTSMGPGPSANWTTLGFTSAGPTTTTEISSFTVSGSTGNITVSLNAFSNTLVAAGSTVTFMPSFGQTAVTWNVSCVPTGATYAPMAKVFGCP